MYHTIEAVRILTVQKLLITVCVSLLFACHSKPLYPVMFQVLDHTKTGLNFSNTLTNTDSFNMFKYMYFYNGGGVAAGDFNNDGLTDLFFASNQSQNRLYLNMGQLRFKDCTQQAGIPNDGSWSTGVSVVDINNDGLLDIYVCKVGSFESLHGKNEMLICERIDGNGVPVYRDKAPEYGLDFSGFSTQAAFLDYDMDGDLDMFLLNHSVHQNGTFGERKNFIGTYHPLSGDRLYRNDGNQFTDITRLAGINGSAVGYGLGIAVADINLDGYPDLYIGNDFHENDYLYINQRNGTFKDELTERIEHTSQFTMGVDVADINNDAYPEIISTDMLPADPYILKRSLGEDEYNIYNMKRSYGYAHQFSRNALQLNRKNGMFSEIAMYAGVHATDWSWAPLWVDFDNDGLKDLFVSNGIPKRLNDMDYVNYVSNDEVQRMISENKLDQKEMAIVEKFPEIKLPNSFFKNEGNARFSDMENNIKNSKPTYSNGSVYADFDNDGDLDIVVNNINEPVLLYQNKTNDKSSAGYLKINLKGLPHNINAVGSKIIVFANGGIRTYEKYPVKGFQSSMEVPVIVGLNKTTLDSILVVWPDNTFQPIKWKKGTTDISLTYKPNLPKFDYSRLTSSLQHNIYGAENITANVHLQYKHQENPFNDFDREPLIPFMVSKEGPALAVGDANGDGLDDVFIGSSKNSKSGFFLQTASGTFTKTIQPALDNDSTYEDVDAFWVDVNNDKHADLVVASGGNEFFGRDEHLLPRVYLNDGKGRLTKVANAFPNIFLTASCVAPSDFNGDGYIDLFVGGRGVPWEYGQMPQSYLLENDRFGHFKDVTAKYSKDLVRPGFVKHAVWTDLDKDGDQDIVLALEWDGIVAFVNNNGTFNKTVLTNKKGWWNFTLPVDVDGDGDIDLIAGNAGLNNQLKATEQEPLKLYYNDFDGNGKKEQVLTYFLQHREIPFANKDELQKQMPIIKKRFLYAADFAKASLNEILKDKLNASQVLTANYFAGVVLINDGSMKFSTQELPWQAQLTSYKDAAIVNANNDNLPDILLGGNFYENNIQIGRNDADCGTLLINKGNGNFSCQNLKGLVIKGQVRHIKKITINKKEAFVLARNNDSTIVLSFNKSSQVLASSKK